MSILLTCAVIALLAGATVYFWNTIKEGYILYFAPWIKEKCGEHIGELCDKIFSALDDNVRFVRREAKEIKEFFQKILCKYDLTYTKKDAETTEIQETVVVRQADGSFVQRDISKTVSNDELPYSVTEKVLAEGSFRVNAKEEIIEKKLQDCLEN